MTIIRKDIQQVTAFAPATAANIGVGFDILGMALNNAGDEVTAKLRQQSGVIIDYIAADFKLSMEANKNIASIAAQALLQDKQIKQGFTLSIKKGIPLGSGMGGSAASAVAALVAVNAFLQTPLTPTQLLPYAVQAEGVVNGVKHADNVAPALLGGLVLCGAGGRIQSLPAPPLTCVVFHVDIVVHTHAARQLMPNKISLSQATQISAKLASWIHALYQQDSALFAELLQSNVLEQGRISLWPHYAALKQTAMASGALAVCVSGSGPCLLAWVPPHHNAQSVKQAMEKACQQRGWTCRGWIKKQPAKGARVIQQKPR